MAGVALRSPYGRIDFSAEDALVITDAQGIYCMEELDILTYGEIENLWKVVRIHGGINPITNVANFGLKFSLRDENNMNIARFFLRHKIRTRRVIVAIGITLYHVRLLRDIKESEK